ncbi:tetratricopeptide repeat protein [Alienimonas californiensis]|uniref:Serine protease HhoA n=1 Tax=Alienimonas californiensis TaxID=2527989 RepID=A0A517PAG8_9PLAN|nr:tetratricopeptide repeat protein [Alienimonas californiensis]QDT16365.1 Putative serine protease HhoA precursor [Alienimonas californiensis]
MSRSAAPPRRHAVRPPWFPLAATVAALLCVMPSVSSAGPPSVIIEEPGGASTAPPVIVDTAPSTAVPATPQRADGSRTMAPSEVYRHVLKSVVLIINEKTDSEGNRSVGFGTGWVMDVSRGLIVTNQHVVGSSNEVRLIFPLMQGDRLLTALEVYGLSADGLTFDDDTPRGEVLHSENDRDLALIRALPRPDGRRLPDGAQALTLADRQVWPGERVHTIAGWPRGSESLWIYGTGTVRQVSQRTLASGAKTTVMESDALINQGNSGGAVVDDSGEVVAVVEGFSTDARGLSLFVGLDAVRSYLDGALPLIDPQSAEDRVALAKSHMEAGRYDRGILTMNEAIALEPTNAGYIAVRGLMFAFNSDFDTAKLDLDEANRLAPNDPLVQGNLGQFYLLFGDLDQAVESLTRAIRNDPTNAEYYGFRGLARKQAEAYDKAVSDLSRAIHFAPNDVNLLMRRGEAHRLNGDYDAAIADHRAAVEKLPASPEPLDALGQDLYAAGRHREAAETFIQAVVKEPTEGMYHFRLGDALQETGDWARGLKPLEKAIELMPNHAPSRYYAGLSHHNLGDDRAAVQRYREALQLDDSDPYLRYNLGISLRALGQEDEAREQFALAGQANADLADPNGEAALAGNDGGNMAAGDGAAAGANFRRIGNVKELAGTWKADFTYNGEIRVQDTTTIQASGAMTSDRTVSSTDPSNSYVERTNESGRILVDGDQVLIGEQGKPFTRHNYKYSGDEFHIEYKELGGTVIWYRQ